MNEHAINLAAHALTAAVFGGAITFGILAAGHETPEYPEYARTTASAAAPIPDTAEGRGELVYQRAGCMACHTTDGNRLVGPTFKGLLGREEQSDTGEDLVADEAYIRESIREPSKVTVATYPKGAMPAYAVEALPDSDVDDLIAWLKTLR